MNRKSGIKRSTIISLMVIFVFISGCSKEKAEAIKLAAGQFRAEAVSALDNVENLFKQGASNPVESSEERLKDITNSLSGTGNITSKKLDFLLNEGNIGQESVNAIDKEFEELKARYYLFEGMFRSLPAGSYFAKDAVKKAEKHAINMTLEFIKFADTLQSWPVQFTGRRILLIEKIAKGKAIQDANLRALHLELSAQDILTLEKDEKTAKEKAILQCLKASEAGKLVAELIRKYEKLNVSDILDMTKDTLGFVSEISDGDLDSLMEEFNSVETSITGDKYWSKVLDVNLN